MFKSKFLRLNLVALALWLLALALNSRLDVWWLKTIPGLAILFLIGLNTAVFVDSICGRILTKLQIAMLGGATAPILLGAVVWQSHALSFDLDPKRLFISIIGAYLISLILLIAAVLKTKRPEIGFEAKKSKINILLFVGLIIAIFLIINFLIYKYIPEADGYNYLINLEKFKSVPILPEESGRGLFYAIILGTSYLTGLKSYFVLKAIIPLMSLVTLLPGFELARRLTKNNAQIFLGSVAPFLFPVIVMEFLYARPQLIFAYFIFILTYIAANLIESKKKTALIIIFYFFLLSTIGLKIHEFFIFALIILAIFSIPLIWNLVNKKIGYFILIVLASATLVYPYARAMGLINQVAYFAKPFISVILHPHFRAWFLNYYVNTDGTAVGWSGIYAWIYYGYNLGIAFIAALIIYLIRPSRQKIKIVWWPYLVPILIFFSIAEIFPRLGLAFLPDRAWFLTSLCAAIFVPVLFIAALKKYSLRASSILIAIIIVVSFGISLTITDLKKGWVLAPEVQAANFIKQNTPENSIIVSQPGNFTVVSYFAGRTFLAPATDVFQNNATIERADLVSNIDQIIDSKENILAQAKAELKSIRDVLLPLTKENGLISDQQIKNSIDVANQDLNEIAAFKRKAVRAESEAQIESKPIYLMYSEEKFASLYGQREWWKSMNFYDPNQKNFVDAKLIYDQNSIKIWQLK